VSSNKPLRYGHWNVRCRVTLDYARRTYDRDPGWRMLSIGIFKLAPMVPIGDDARYHVERGFWWEIDFWLPWRIRA